MLGALNASSCSIVTLIVRHVHPRPSNGTKQYYLATTPCKTNKWCKTAKSASPIIENVPIQTPKFHVAQLCLGSSSSSSSKTKYPVAQLHLELQLGSVATLSTRGSLSWWWPLNFREGAYTVSLQHCTEFWQTKSFGRPTLCMPMVAPQSNNEVPSSNLRKAWATPLHADCALEVKRHGLRKAQLIRLHADGGLL
eukprot:1035608-Pelagomonas_calceolata.AAC.2